MSGGFTAIPKEPNLFLKDHKRPRENSAVAYPAVNGLAREKMDFIDV
jgi:hypothetical protein